MRKVIWVALLAVLVVALVAVLAGCGNEETTTTTAGGTGTTAGGTDTTGGATATTAAGEPVMGGVAKIAVLSVPAKFGVPADVIGPDQWFEGIFLEGMFYPTDQADKYMPALAESWDLAADKSSYTFHLRKGVTFTDGTPFNAQACKFCWDLMLAPAAAAGGPPAGGTDTAAAGGAPAGGPPGGPAAGPPPDFAFVKSIDVVDDYTVKVNLKYWSNQVLPFIGRKSWAVFSPTAYQQMGKDKMDTNPVGTGPFMLKTFTPNQEMLLTKNPSYWMKDAKGNQLPYLDGVDILVFKDPTTMTVAVQSNQVDGADHLPPTGAKQLSGNPDFQLSVFGGPYQMITMNTTDPASIWSDLKMRQALEYAIDKEGIAKSIGLGFAPAVYEVIHSVSDVADAGTTPRKYDPEKAKALIKESGKQIPAEITLSYNATEGDPNMPTAIQANLAAVGIKVKLNGVPQASFGPIMVKPPTGSDLVMNGLRGGSPNVLQGAIEMYGQGTIYFPGAKFPDQFYALMDQAQQVANIADTFPICGQMEKIGYDDAQVIPTQMQEFVSISGPHLKNMVWFFANTPTPWFQEAWLTK